MRIIGASSSVFAVYPPFLRYVDRINPVKMNKREEFGFSVEIYKNIC